MAYLDMQGIHFCIGYCLSSMAYLNIQGIKFVLDLAYPQWLNSISREYTLYWILLILNGLTRYSGNKLCIGYCLFSMA